MVAYGKRSFTRGGRTWRFDCIFFFCVCACVVFVVVVVVVFNKLGGQLYNNDKINT